MLRALLPALTIYAFASPAQAETPYVFQPGHIDLDRGPDGNTVILDAPDGLIVVDTGRHAEHSRAILDYAKASGRPIAAIVNSHWHLDHTTGNQDVLAAFPEAELIASNAAAGALSGFLAQAPDNARKRIADPALSLDEHRRAERALAILTHPEMLVPANPVTASGPRIIAGRTIDVRLAPDAATEGDIWLLVPDERLAITGDLVVAQAPFFDTGCEDGWETALEEIEAADWDTLIPGHGAPMDRAGFDRWHAAFTTYVECAHSDAGAEACAAGWEHDAAGFYTEAEGASVRELALYYIIDVLRAPPEARMDYCRKGGSPRA